jgi:hypothetical protein
LLVDIFIILSPQTFVVSELMQNPLVFTIRTNVIALPWGMNFRIYTDPVFAVLTVKIFSHRRHTPRDVFKL